MIRWLRLMMVRRAFLALLVICLGCSAQSPPSQPSPASPASPSQSSTTAPSPDLAKLLERQVRSHYSVPPDVKVLLGPLRSSEFANYDALTVTFSSPTKRQDFDFLLSHDHKTLMRVTRLN